jgi:hypothetical protein
LNSGKTSFPVGDWQSKPTLGDITPIENKALAVFLLPVCTVVLGSNPTICSGIKGN